MLEGCIPESSDAGKFPTPPPGRCARLSARLHGYTIFEKQNASPEGLAQVLVFWWAILGSNQ